MTETRHGLRSHFEAVEVSALMVSQDSGQTMTGAVDEPKPMAAIYLLLD